MSAKADREVGEEGDALLKSSLALIQNTPELTGAH